MFRVGSIIGNRKGKPFILTGMGVNFPYFNKN